MNRGELKNQPILKIDSRLWSGLKSRLADQVWDQFRGLAWVEISNKFRDDSKIEIRVQVRNQLREELNEHNKQNK